MKSIILCTLLVTMCFYMKAQGDCKGFYDRDLAVGKHYINCTAVTCHSEGYITAVDCGTYQCPEGKQIGYREIDLSKPYPECCDGPICAS